MFERVETEDCVSAERVVEDVDGSSSAVLYLFRGDDVVETRFLVAHS